MSESLLRVFVAPRRYDGSAKFRYPVDSLESNDRRWVVHGIFGPEIGPHSERLGFFPGDHTIEFYPIDCWWNVYAVFSPTGLLRGYYCNIGQPPYRDGDAIVYVDLDLDLLVRADGSQVVMDEEEYQQRAERFGYSCEVRQRVQAALDELIALATARAAPFDGLEARALLGRVIELGPESVVGA